MTTTGGKWMTVKEDHRRLFGCICQAVVSGGLVGCGIALPSPFYEVGGRSSWVLCPACASKHFGVTSPKAERPKIRVTNATSVVVCVNGVALSAGATDMIWEARGYTSVTQCPGVMPYLIQSLDGSFTIHDAARPMAIVAPAASPPKPEERPAKCLLPWCDAPQMIASPCCSMRCEDYCRRYEKIVKTRDAFLAKLKAHNGGHHSPWLDGERDWANAQADREIAPIREQWRALKVDRAAHEPEGT